MTDAATNSISGECIKRTVSVGHDKFGDTDQKEIQPIVMSADMLAV
jgi:hypothetical protein